MSNELMLPPKPESAADAVMRWREQGERIRADLTAEKELLQERIREIEKTLQEMTPPDVKASFTDRIYRCVRDATRPMTYVEVASVFPEVPPVNVAGVLSRLRKSGRIQVSSKKPYRYVVRQSLARVVREK